MSTFHGTNIKVSARPASSYKWGLVYIDTCRVDYWFKTQKDLLRAAHANGHRPGSFAVARYTIDFPYSSERGFI